MTRTRTRTTLASAALVALALAGVTAPAAASTAGAVDAVPTDGAQFQATAMALLREQDQVQAVARDAAGNVVVYTTDAEAALGEPLESAANVVIRELTAPLTAQAATDVVGGAGYVYVSTESETELAMCSLGFAGWSPAGDPALITAGHCAEDGTVDRVWLSVPSADRQGRKVPMYELGSFGFSQYGGPGNTPGGEGELDSVDVAVIDVDNPALDLLPAVTTWSDEAVAADDLSLSTVPVRAVGEVRFGAVTKSGRTTGTTTGTVDSVRGWARVGHRFVYGFGANIEVGYGDSGGAVYQGGTAVGIVSGSGDDFAWIADLGAALAVTGGYTVALQIDAPELVSPADGGQVSAGGAVSGTGQAGTTLVVEPEGAAAFEVPIGGDGRWSFPAPGRPGRFAFTLSSYAGHDVSAARGYSLIVVPAASVIPSSPEVAAAPAGILPATGPEPGGSLALAALTLVLLGTGTLMARGRVGSR